MNEELANKENFAEFSKNKLALDIAMRIRTAFIYPIAEWEKDFNELCDENNQEEIDPPEVYKEKFIKWRKKVLDNGNNQLRHAVDELIRYNILFKGNNNGK